MESIGALWIVAVTALAGHVIAPLLGFLDLGNLPDDPREISQALLVSSVPVAIVGCVFRPMETSLPAEHRSDRRH